MHALSSLEVRKEETFISKMHYCCHVSSSEDMTNELV